MRIGPSYMAHLKTILAFSLLALSPRPGNAQTWEAIHAEMREALGSLPHEYFSGAPSTAEVGQIRAFRSDLVPFPWMIVVGFTGGLETKDSRASGTVALNRHLTGSLGEGNGVWTRTYNNTRWRRAAAEVMEVVRSAQERAQGIPGYRQPLIVVHGHSLGAGSVTKLARAMGNEGLEISLAVYIDAFQLRNPRLPGNIRYAVNFYQRALLPPSRRWRKPSSTLWSRLRP